MLLSQLLRTPVGSRLVRADLDGTTLTLGIVTTTPHSTCPSCRQESWRIHSRYARKLAEEPLFGHRVRLQITVRRFFCQHEQCPRRIFVEPLEGFAARSARTTTRVARIHLAIGSALGGEAGARLAEKLAVPTSPDTLLRRVKRAEARSPESPRFVGIDDWAWRKGQRYGTIVVDLETNEVIATATPRRSRPGSPPILASSWSAATAHRPIPGRPARPRRRHNRWPIDGTS